MRAMDQILGEQAKRGGGGTLARPLTDVDKIWGGTD